METGRRAPTAPDDSTEEIAAWPGAAVAGTWPSPSHIMTPMRSDLPTGTVTFLFTDVEGSTGLLRELVPRPTRRYPHRECEIAGGKVAGVAVVVGAHAAALAGPGEVLATSTVKDLVAGSDLTFEPRGVRELKGFGGTQTTKTTRGSSLLCRTVPRPRLMSPRRCRSARCRPAEP
jgi:hypothetical protein